MNLLETRELHKSFGGKKVVNGVNIGVRKGEVVGLLGPNGAGKTTTFNMIVGLENPSSGDIFFNNRQITNMPMHRRARSGIAYLPQEPSIFRKLSVEENIMAVLETMSMSKKERKKRLCKLLEELRIAHLAKNKAYTLSGGERRRLEITRALVTEPQFMLLDEPFSGIDPIAVYDAQKIIEDLRKNNLGILLTDHNVRETLAITNRSYLINEGKILFSGTADELISNPKVIEIYLGEKFQL